MSGAASRRKGANYERRVAAWLRERLGVEARRYRAGSAGDDIEHGIPWLSIEAKDRASDSLGSWVDQARRQARPDQIPVVIHHRRGCGSVAGDFVTMHAEDFARLVELVDYGWRDAEALAEEIAGSSS